MAPWENHGAIALADTRTDRQAFLAALREAPDDDAPRLAFADWLMERGDVYGEFVKVQVELARTKVHPNGHTDIDANLGPFINEKRDCTRGDCKACALRRRERALLVGNAGRWWAEWMESLTTATGGGKPVVRIDFQGTALDDPQYFRRGFIEVIPGITAADWLAHGDAILAEHPVREVRLTTLPAVERSLTGGIVVPVRMRLLGGEWQQVRAGVSHSDRVVDLLGARWPSVNKWDLLSALVSRVAGIPAGGASASLTFPV